MKMLLATLLAAFPLAAAPSTTYTHPTCHYSFRYPAGWKVAPEKGSPSPCAVEVSPAEVEKVDEATAVWVDSGEGGFETASERTYVQAVTEYTREKSKEPKPPVGAFVAFNAAGAWRRGRRIQAGPLEGGRVDGIVLECAVAPCAESVAFLTGGLRWVSVQGPVKGRVFELVLGSIAGITPRLVRYSSPLCGFSFQHLTDWRVSNGDGPCEFKVRPRNFEALMKELDVDEWTILVEAGQGDFEDGAEAAEFKFVTADSPDGETFPQIVGQWVAFGFHRWGETTELHAGWQRGLRGTHIPFRRHRRAGGNAGLSSYGSAFLSDGARWVAVTASGEPAELDFIVKNLRLIPVRH